jgi:hypothetical protein
MNVIVTVSRGKEATYMKTFTIDSKNNISVFASKKEAAESATPLDPFTSQEELAKLAAVWPASRLVAIWNNIPGVTAITKFTNRKIATERIWKAIQNLGVAAPKPEAAGPCPVGRCCGTRALHEHQGHLNAQHRLRPPAPLTRAISTREHELQTITEPAIQQER